MAQLRQITFRGYEDGAEGQNPHASEGSNWTQPVDTIFRVRFGIEAFDSSIVDTQGFQLQFNFNSSGWFDVNSSSSWVRSAATANIIDGSDTNQELVDYTSVTPTFVTGEFDEVDGLVGDITLTETDPDITEVEFCAQIRSADVANNDTIQLRVVKDDGVALDEYSATPSLTVQESTTEQVSSTDGAVAGEDFTVVTTESFPAEGAVAGDSVAGEVSAEEEALTDGASAGDSLAGRLDSLALPSDGAVASDALQASQALLGALTDGAVASDSAEGDQPGIASLTDGAVAGEDFTIVTSQSFPAEGAVAGDSVSAGGDQTGSLTDGAVAGESFATAITTQFPDEGAVAGDSVEASAETDLSALPTDGAVAGDSLTALQLLSQAITDGALAGDSPAVLLAVAAALTDGAIASDSAAAEETEPGIGLASDGARAGESLTASLTSLTSLGDGAVAGDSIGATGPPTPVSGYRRRTNRAPHTQRLARP